MRFAVFIVLFMATDTMRSAALHDDEQQQLTTLLTNLQHAHNSQISGLKSRLESSESRVKYLELELQKAQTRAEGAEAALATASFARVVEFAAGSSSPMPPQRSVSASPQQAQAPPVAPRAMPEATSAAVPYEPAVHSAMPTAHERSHESRGFPPIVAEPVAFEAVKAAYDDAARDGPNAPVLHPSMLGEIVATSAQAASQPAPAPRSGGSDDVELRAAMEVASRLLATAKQESDMAASAQGWIPEAERKALAEKALDKLKEAQSRVEALEASRVEVATAKSQVAQAEAAGAYVSAAEKKQISEEAEAKLVKALERQRGVIVGARS